MQIFWHGLSCVRIESESGEQHASLVTDPYDSDSGLRFPRTLEPDVLAVSQQSKDEWHLSQFQNKPFVIAEPGEYEVKGLFVYAIGLRSPERKSEGLVFRFEIEGMSIAFLGGARRLLTDEEAGKLENVDILLLPVGGGERLTAQQAITTMNEIEPRLVVPLYHHTDGVKQNLGTADAFCKALGACQRQDANKLKISKKDLPSDTVVVTVLERA